MLRQSIETGLYALEKLEYLRELDLGDLDNCSISAEEIEKYQQSQPFVNLVLYQDSEPQVEKSTAKINRSWYKNLANYDDDHWLSLVYSIESHSPETKPLNDRQLAEGLQNWLISLSDKNIIDITPISAFRWATNVWLDGNQIADIGPIGALTMVRALNLKNNSIKSLAALNRLQNLSELNVSHNQIDGLEDLGSHPRLIEFNASHNVISSMQGIEGLPQLLELNLSNNRMTSLRPLQNLRQLTNVNVADNRLTDLTPFKHCLELTQVVCFNNPGLCGLMALVELPFLQCVLSHGSLPKDEIQAFRTARPEVRVD